LLAEINPVLDMADNDKWDVEPDIADVDEHLAVNNVSLDIDKATVVYA
jgi:hypothetical protein